MRRHRTTLGGAWTALIAVAILVLAFGAGAEEAVPAASEAADLVLRQLAALRALDFAAAYALASSEMRRHFSRGEFEWMVKRAHPEVVSSTFAAVVRTHDAGAYVYVTVKVHGKNGTRVEALYEIVREGGTLKVNALSTRHDDGLL